MEEPHPDRCLGPGCLSLEWGSRHLFSFILKLSTSESGTDMGVTVPAPPYSLGQSRWEQWTPAAAQCHLTPVGTPLQRLLQLCFCVMFMRLSLHVYKGPV